MSHLSTCPGRGDYVFAVGLVTAFIGVAFAAEWWLALHNLSQLFIVAVLIVAARSGLGPSLLASVLGFLSFNFLFTAPRYTFKIENDADLLTLIVFLLVATITGNLTARMKRESANSHASLTRVNTLYEFARHMSSATDAATVGRSLVHHTSQLLGGAVALLLPDAEGRLTMQHSSAPPPRPPLASIHHYWRRGSGARAKIDGWHVFPLLTDRRTLGLLALESGSDDAEQQDLVQGLCDQAALALDRTLLAADLEEARIVSETEQLRSALLSSVSHDLRTPLASIIGSTTSLLEYGDNFKREDRLELLRMVVDEARRLDRYIQNLLDMTRLGEGKLQLKRDWVDLRDVIASAVDRSRSRDDIVLDVQLGRDLPLLWIHGMLIEQALVNLIDNAICFSPLEGRIVISAWHHEDRVTIDICDQGPGIPESEREKVFDMFYSARRGDADRSPGTGLGLAICRGLVGAHGGNVTARAAATGPGTCMRIELPLLQPATEHAA